MEMGVSAAERPTSKDIMSRPRWVARRFLHNDNYPHGLPYSFAKLNKLNTLEVRSVCQKQALTTPARGVHIGCTIGRLRHSQEASHIDLSEIRQTKQGSVHAVFLFENHKFNLKNTIPKPNT